MSIICSVLSVHQDPGWVELKACETHRADSAHEQLMRSGDHNVAIEIHWLVYTFPWWQP